MIFSKVLIYKQNETHSIRTFLWSAFHFEIMINFCLLQVCQIFQNSFIFVCDFVNGKMVTVHSVHSNVAQILYPELTFLSLYRIIKYYSFKNIFKKGVIIHAG